MRNLKRVLSLALALVMVLGMMVIGTSAATYADAEEITYTEAVDVMSALEILEGDGTNYNPTDILTREQAAKIVAYMLLGKQTADKLVGTGAFTDVAATRWSAGYIDYCASLNILAGNGDGTYDPTGKLTGVAFAKMLLIALGYDAAVEGYVNNKNWATNISSDAFAAKLDIKGVTLAGQVTREQAAQMAFQALTANMVEYPNGKGTDINFSDGTSVNIGAGASAPVTCANTSGYLQDAGSASGNDTTVQFCEKYFPSLKLDETTETDDYGRPAYTWTYTKLGKTLLNKTYAEAASATVTLTKGYTDLDEAYKALVDKKYAGSDIDVALGSAASVNGTTSWTANYGGTGKYLGTGDVVEFFLTGSTVTDALVIRETAAQIVNVLPNTGKATVTINGEDVVYNYNIYIDTDLNGTSDITTTDLTLAGYTAEYVKDTYLVVVLKGSTVLSSKVAETVVGAATAWTDGKDITVNGTKYDYATSTIVDPASINWKYGTYEVVLGSSNQALAIETVTGSVSLSDIVYFTGTVWAEDTTKYGSTSGTVYAQVVDMAGVTSDVVVGYYNGENGNDAAWVSGGYDSTIAQITSNTVGAVASTAGLYSIATVPAAPTYGEYKDLTAVGTSNYLKATTSDTIGADTTLKTTDKKFGTYYVTDETVYILVTGSAATLKAKTYTGGVGYAVDASADTDFVLYTTVGGNNVAQAVVIKVGASSYTTTGAEVLFMSGTVDTTNANGYVATLYKKDGTAVDCTITSTGGAGFWTYTVNDKGAYVLADVTAATIGSNADYNPNNFTLGAYYENAVYSSSYYDGSFNATQSTFTLSDIDASKAVVVDLRSPVAKAANYNATINSVEGLDAAAATYKVNTTTENVVTISMYVDNNGAQVIFVTSVN